MWDYRQLRVWHRARRLVAAVYEATGRYPGDERFGLTAQTRRASVSIAANLAEGTGRRGPRDFARFVDFSVGSAYELECHLLLGRDLGFLPDTPAMVLMQDVDEVKRMLIALSLSLRSSERDP